MNYLLIEIGLRFIRVLAAAIVGTVIYLVAVGPLGATPSVELALLAWLSGAAVVLLLETSPI